MGSSFDIRNVKSTFIFNPHSGHNARNPYLLERTRAFIAQHDLDASLQLTERPKHATELAKTALDHGVNAVIAIGGDGTINEVARALVDGPHPLGLIPCGSGNGLGRHLGIPQPNTAAYDALLAGQVRAIDYGTANHHHFFNVAGLGFDAEISARFNRLTRRGLMAYVRTTLKAWRSSRPEPYTIHGEDGTYVTDAFIIAVANSDQYGNNCYIAPGAQVSDGLMNLTIIKRINWLIALPLAVRLFTGSIGQSAHVKCLIGSHFKIERATAGPIHTDGEVHETSADVEIQVYRQGLNLIVPRKKA
jgi:diacylglycerol kinase (ATP)